ncbi:MAG: hypothetical protein KBF75_15135 [Saprospiraceae bacterium]|nr:hypothetical protein [Saprospiraceae bacterium]
MDDTVATSYKFIDENNREYPLELEELKLSEPYRECQLSGSVESVSCTLTKKIKYVSNALNFDLILFYKQIEVPGNNPAVNNCFYLIELIDKDKEDHVLTLPLDLFRGIDTVNVLKPLDKYELAGQEYTDVLIMKIDSMIVYDTFETFNVTYIDDTQILEVIFQIPNGIVGLTLKSGERLILKED